MHSGNMWNIRSNLSKKSFAVSSEKSYMLLNNRKRERP